MSDIQKCAAVDSEGRVCRVAHECYRQTSEAGDFQAYGQPGNGFDPKDGCDNYWPLKWEPKGKKND